METRTNIVLDDVLVNQVMARAGVKTKKAAIEAALKAYIRKPDYSAIMALRNASPRVSFGSSACRLKRSVTSSRADCECTDQFVTSSARVPA